MSDKKKNTENSKTVVFDGNEYRYSDLITTNGDSVRTYLPVHLVKPGQLYTIKHVSSPDGTLKLLTSVETGEMFPTQEVRISPTSSWGKTLMQTFPRWSGQFQPSDDYSTAPWWLKMFYKITGYKLGGWLHKYKDGGMTQQPSQEQVMKELLTIVQQAATELQSNKPGQGVQTLAQIANDPQGSQLLDALVQQVPEAGQIVEAVMKMVGAFKCGGKAKKKVKKGAKGCVPCKKLMRVGGKLINVWSDCEGNIISKHQSGGWLIPKGLVGLTAQFVQEPYRKAKAGTDAGNAKDVHYYLGDDNKIYTQTYVDGTGWGSGLLADMNNFKNWATTANTSGQILGKNFFVNGFNFDYNTNMGTMSETDAQAAGIDGSKYATVGKVVDGVVGEGGNDLYGIEAKDPTKRDALNQRGLSTILNATFVRQKAANALAKENFRTQRRAVLADKNLWGKGYLKNARNTKNTIIALNNAEASKDRAAWMTEFGHMNTPSNTTVEIPKYQPVAGTTPDAATTAGYQSTSAKYKKQGGWLNKFN